MGETEARILKECYAWRRPIPEKIQNAPELLMGLELYFRAFQDLNTTRPTGWTAGPIPWADIEAYAQSVGFEPDSEEREDLHFLVRKMDIAFLEAMKEKS